MNVKKIISVILVVVWMSVIFSFSNQQGEGSGNTSRKVCEVIISIVDISDQYTEMEKEQIIKILEPVIRKEAHYTIYLIGGILIANSVYQFYNKEQKMILISTIIGVLYAISDEVHQLAVAGRSGRIIDVIIDSLGIMTGIMLFLVIKYSIKGIKEKSKIRG